MAGIVGVNPMPLTLRELMLMSEGRIRHEWDHTSQICMIIANCHRDPKKGRPFKAADFNPYAKGEADTNRIAANKANIMALRPAIKAMKKRT